MLVCWRNIAMILMFQCRMNITSNVGNMARCIHQKLVCTLVCFVKMVYSFKFCTSNAFSALIFSDNPQRCTPDVPVTNIYKRFIEKVCRLL